MQFIVKKFTELSTQELYELLQLRSEVFVVEQHCVYQDIDNKDQKALHILGIKKNKIIAYTRVFKAGDYFKTASIGRVLIVKNDRKFGYGHQLMNVSIEVIKNIFNETTVTISAQTYLKNFYESHAFKQEGKEYLEDGLPHIKMVMTL